MNLLLLFPEDFIDKQLVRITARRQQHLLSIQKVQIGDTLTVGKVNGQIGTGQVLSIETTHIDLEVNWQKDAPPPLPLTLIIALPRPKMLKRIIQTCATMGVKDIYFINALKVEKSFWQTPWLTEPKLEENLILGLEQGIDTVMPVIHQRKRFKPFVEDELPTIAAQTKKWVAHPGGKVDCPRHFTAPTTLAIGPEGGFIDYEVAKLEKAGFTVVDMGPRILRVETAVTALLSRF